MNKYIFKYNQTSNRERIIIADNIADAEDKFEKEKQYYSDKEVELIERKVTDVETVKCKKKFNFRIERLLSIWESQDVCVEADSLEEAKAKLMDPNTFDDTDAELLYETLDSIDKDTKFKNTVEVYLEDPEYGSYAYLENVESL